MIESLFGIAMVHRKASLNRLGHQCFGNFNPNAAHLSLSAQASEQIAIATPNVQHAPLLGDIFDNPAVYFRPVDNLLGHGCYSSLSCVTRFRKERM